MLFSVLSFYSIYPYTLILVFYNLNTFHLINLTQEWQQRGHRGPKKNNHKKWKEILMAISEKLDNINESVQQIIQTQQNDLQTKEATY